MKNPVPILLLNLVIFSTSAQSFSPGWSGNEIVQHAVFMDTARWTKNVASYASGDRCSLAAIGDTLQINYSFASGSRDKWAQCYLYFSTPLDLGSMDLFGIDAHGTNTNAPVGFELKFEDGSHQAVIGWDNLGKLDRWAERISVAKKQFSNASFNWNAVRVISVAVYNRAADGYTSAVSGSMKFKNLIASSMAGWTRATDREFINAADFTSIRDNALAAIIARQKSTGLLTTWNEDGTSWLYGQGLALKALSLEGAWNQGIPTNAAATAAEKLALFLAGHQQSEGYWPRAWNSSTGAITVLREADGTVWMGDFPWPITGLQAYYKRSGDTRVTSSIQKGLAFLTNLIGSDGKFMTVNPQTGSTYEVASCEAYAAAILALQESGDTLHANKLISYISTNGWDSQIQCWREATYSDRIVLFANTWMANFQFQQGKIQEGMNALTLAGKVMYTHGNGQLYGMDGIVPLAVWFEGTLSYIAAGGPGSVALFDAIKNFIHPDGMISHYNENLGGMGGIWAVDWHSLDGTSWLYFTSGGSSPFNVTEGIPVSVKNEALQQKEVLNCYFDQDGNLVLHSDMTRDTRGVLNLISLDGRILYEKTLNLKGLVVIPASELPHSCPLLIVRWNNGTSFESKLIPQMNAR